MTRINAWLIYNYSLNTSKFNTLHDWYVKTASKKNINLQLLSNIDVYSMISNSKPLIVSEYQGDIPDFVLFLDKDIALARQLELLGYRVYNSSEVIAICDNKIHTHQVLSKHGITMPKTIYAPLSFIPCLEIEEEFLCRVERELSYPMVVKEAFGSFGKQVYLAKSREDLFSIRKSIGTKPHLYQEYISSSYGRDVRIYVVGSRVVASTLRRSEDDFRANATVGGKMYVYQPKEEFLDMAVTVSNLIGADFSGVDILFGQDEEPIFCEINSNAHIINVYNTTKIDVSEHIFDYILEDILHA